MRQSEFQQLPYHRIFIMLLLELNAPEHVLETINFQTLTAFWYVFWRWLEQSGSPAGSLLPLGWFNCLQSGLVGEEAERCSPRCCLLCRAGKVLPWVLMEEQFCCCALLTCSNFSCSNTFHILRPTKAPGFVYAWLELISHRIFIARMLAHTPQQKVWLHFISSQSILELTQMLICCGAVSHLSKCTSKHGWAVLLLSAIFTVT